MSYEFDNQEINDLLERINVEEHKDKDDFFVTRTNDFIIWRIEKLNAVLWPEKLYGIFFSGDSYIIYNRDYYGKIDIYTWCGDNTTRDELTSATVKAIELDNFYELSCKRTIHHENQGMESLEFLSLFNIFIVLDGGIDGNGNSNGDYNKYNDQLFHIKSVGKTLTCTPVPISTSSLNSGDVFVLDLGLNIYQWNGRSASGNEKTRAAELTSKLKSERNGLPNVIIYEQDDEDATPFWDALGGKKDIKEGSTERLFEPPKKIGGDKILFRLSNVSGSIQFKEEARNNLELSMLDTNDVFIIDVQSEIFIWVGNKSSVMEKSRAFLYASNYIRDTKKPSNTPITRVIEGNEDEVFNSYFK